MEASLTKGVRFSGRKWFALLLILPLVIYCILPTRNYYWDGVAFAIDIEKRLPTASLVHPSHLAYTLWGAWLYRLSESAGVHTRALFLMQAANSVLAGLCVILLSKCLRLRKVPMDFSVSWALVFGFSATWWRFATDANAYVPSIFFVLCAYVLLERPGAAILAGLATAGAMLFHELAFLFLPVALLRLSKSRRSMVEYTAAALIPVAAAYLVAFRTVTHHATINGFVSWVTSHSPDSGFSFNPFKDFALSARGSLRLFLGGRLDDFAGDRISQAGFVALVIAVVTSCVRSLRALRGGAKLSFPSRHVLVWTGVYAAFLFFWMPQNTFYRLFYLPPLIVMLATMLRYAPTTRTAVWLFVPVLLLWNFVFLAYPQSRPEFNVPLRFALAQRKGWAPGTPVVFHTFHPDLWTISYFSQQAAWIGIDRFDPAQMERNLAYARTQGTPLWLEATAHDLIAADPDGQRWLALHERPNELIEFNDEKHQFRFHCVR